MKRQTRCDRAHQDNKKISLTWAIRKSQLEIIGFLYFKRYNPDTWALEGEYERGGFIIEKEKNKGHKTFQIEQGGLIPTLDP